MNMLEELLGQDAASVVQKVGHQFGLDETQASSALAALLPALVAGFHHRASSQSGLEALENAMRGPQDQGSLDNLQSLGGQDIVNLGNGILGQIFGSRDVSREVARRASTQAGVGSDVLKRMLPVVDALAMGALARRQFGTASAQAGVMPTGAPRAQTGSLLDLLTPMLDANRDGTMVDDVIGMIGKVMAGR